jgi:hypothetical protein
LRWWHSGKTDYRVALSGIFDRLGYNAKEIAAKFIHFVTTVSNFETFFADCPLLFRQICEIIVLCNHVFCEYTVPRHELDFSQEGEKVGK